MRKFRITFVKQNKFTIGKPQNIPIISAEQIINTDIKDSFDIPVPQGYEILQICEILPDIDIFQNIDLKN